MKRLAVPLHEDVFEQLHRRAGTQRHSLSTIVSDLVSDQVRRVGDQRSTEQWLAKQRCWKSDGSPYPGRPQ